MFAFPYNLGGEGKRQKRGYQGDAEYFGIYSPETGKVYLIQVDECPVGETNLYIAPIGRFVRNQFSTGIHLAKDYEI